jgi:C1A family cysteine protease
MSRSNSGFLTRSVLLTLVLLGMVFLATGVSAVADGSAQNAGATGNGLQRAPVNPSFIQYSQDKAAGLDTAQVTEEGYKLGLIPSPISRPEVKDIPIFVSSAGIPMSTYAATYDLRTAGGINKVSPVKNQGQFGTCWAHATFGSLESTLMPATPAPDFSEKNLANLHGFDLDPANGGGNMWMSTATLTRWDGPVAETSDPYPFPSTTTWWTTSPTFASTKHVQNVIFFPSHTTTGLASTYDIKKVLTTPTYGAVYSSFYWHSNYYNATSAAYYQPYNTAADPAGGGGHAVTIIGWNDNYAKTNFKTVPAGNGAWLVKNSWGTAWGNAGYFWISYYDKYFGSRYHAYTEAASSTKDTALFRGESAANYKVVYSYDKLGEVYDYSYGTTKTGSFANVFSTTSVGNLSAVGLYTTDMNATVTIKIYKNPTTSPESGTLASTYGPIKLANMGYNTVVLPVAKRVALTKGQKFSVVITVTNPTYDYYIPVEENVDYYTRGIISTTGQGYAKSGVTWADWSTLVPDSHICVKAYTIA